MAVCVCVFPGLSICLCIGGSAVRKSSRLRQRVTLFFASFFPPPGDSSNSFGPIPIGKGKRKQTCLLNVFLFPLSTEGPTATCAHPLLLAICLSQEREALLLTLKWESCSVLVEVSVCCFTLFPCSFESLFF